MSIFYLAKQGYGSLKEIRELDTDELFDILEYEQIQNRIENYLINKAS